MKKSYDIGVSTTINPCTSCGACCAYFRVSFYWSGSGIGPGLVPVEKVNQISPHKVCMAGTDRKSAPRCECLDGNIGSAVRCSIYAVRPGPCRDFQASWYEGLHNPDCDRARAAHGLPPVKPEGDTDLSGPDVPRKIA